jgi:hypothetical protein
MAILFLLLQIAVRTMTGMEIRPTSMGDEWPEMELPQRHMTDGMAHTTYPQEVLEALKGVRYIAGQFKEGDDEKAVSIFKQLNNRRKIGLVVRAAVWQRLDGYVRYTKVLISFNFYFNSLETKILFFLQKFMD